MIITQNLKNSASSNFKFRVLDIFCQIHFFSKCASIQACSHSIVVINLHNFYCKITTEIFISVLKRV